LNGELLLEALAAGLRHRVAEHRRAEERLADFAFREAAAAPTRAAASDSGAPIGTTAWRHYVARMLRSAGELETLELLEALRESPSSLEGLAVRERWRGDRVAVADWIGGLAAVGFVRRELETDRVSLAPLGAAVLDLVTELERRLGADLLPGESPHETAAADTAGPRVRTAAPFGEAGT
jgi:hypothetical protein